MFVRTNSLRLKAQLAILTAAPVQFGESAPPNYAAPISAGGLLLHDSGSTIPNVLSLAIEFWTGWTDLVGDVWFGWRSPAPRPGVAHFSPPWTYLGFVEQPDTNSPWQPAFNTTVNTGDVYQIALRHMDEAGRVSPLSYWEVTSETVV